MQLMDVDILSYTASKWLALQPAIHLFKSARYRYIDQKYRRRPARATALADPMARESNLLVSIAFEDAELIDWQACLVRSYVPAAEYVVVDNSVSTNGAETIRSVCARRRCSYFRTPENPWQGAASRSHGLALNWALDNVIKPRRPRAFGFIDGDIFPTQITNPFEPLHRQDFFGVVRHSDLRWYLWAGFCFFRFSLVERLSLNFGQAWFLGLDTGGANWTLLYKNYELSALETMGTTFFPFKSGLDVSEGPLQWCGPWLHEVGQMGHPKYASAKREALRQLLMPHLGI